MKTYQVIEMPKLGKEEGIASLVTVWDLDMNIQHVQIPHFCNIEKVIILFGERHKTQQAYEKLKKKK